MYVMYVCTYVYVCAYTYLCTYGKATQPIYVPSLTYLNFHHVNPHPQFTLSTPSYGLSSSMEELVVFPPLNPLTLLPPSPLLPLLPHPQFTSPLTPLPLSTPSYGLSSSMEELVVFPPLNPLPLLPHPQFTTPLPPPHSPPTPSPPPSYGLSSSMEELVVFPQGPEKAKATADAGFALVSIPDNRYRVLIRTCPLVSAHLFCSVLPSLYHHLQF